MKGKKKTPMEKLTSGYEKFIENKKINEDGKKKFEKALKKSIKKDGSK